MNRLTDYKITNLIDTASLDYMKIGEAYTTDVSALKSIAASNLVIIELLQRNIEHYQKQGGEPG